MEMLTTQTLNSIMDRDIAISSIGAILNDPRRVICKPQQLFSSFKDDDTLSVASWTPRLIARRLRNVFEGSAISEANKDEAKLTYLTNTDVEVIQNAFNKMIENKNIFTLLIKYLGGVFLFRECRVKSCECEASGPAASAFTIIVKTVDSDDEE